mgnify:CR=1 FL=1
MTAGPLLGLFLLGLLTKARGDTAAFSALILAAALNAWLLWLSQTGALPLDWGWLTLIGVATAMGLGYGFSRLSALISKEA